MPDGTAKEFREFSCGDKDDYTTRTLRMNIPDFLYLTLSHSPQCCIAIPRVQLRLKGSSSLHVAALFRFISYQNVS